MRTKNFFKGLAVAAVALVGVFATSCSEEELNVQGNIIGDPVIHPDPTVLPDGIAYAVVSVVDLGDMGASSKVLKTEVQDVTGKGAGYEIVCPDFDGQEAYVIPAAQKIDVPALEKGQSLSIPLTFYVVKTTSVFANVEFNADEPVEWGNDPETGFDYIMSSVTYTGNEANANGTDVIYNKKLQNTSNYWKDITFKYEVPYSYFTKALNYSTEAPTARANATTAEEIVKAYIENMISDPEVNPTEDTWIGQTTFYQVYSMAYVTFIVDSFYKKPVYEVVYNGESVYVTLEMISGRMAYPGVQAAIPGHEHAYDHSHGHGSYDNAGGGITVWE